MSGGYFGYQQYIIADETKHILKEMALDLVDYLLSGDISEEDFLV